MGILPMVLNSLQRRGAEFAERQGGNQLKSLSTDFTD